MPQSASECPDGAVFNPNSRMTGAWVLLPSGKVKIRML